MQKEQKAALLGEVLPGAKKEKRPFDIEGAKKMLTDNPAHIPVYCSSCGSNLGILIEEANKILLGDLDYKQGNYLEQSGCPLCPGEVTQEGKVIKKSFSLN